MEQLNHVATIDRADGHVIPNFCYMIDMTIVVYFVASFTKTTQEKFH